jgi:hypothetical protein
VRRKETKGVVSFVLLSYMYDYLCSSVFIYNGFGCSSGLTEAALLSLLLLLSLLCVYIKHRISVYCWFDPVSHSCCWLCGGHCKYHFSNDIVLLSYLLE